MTIQQLTEDAEESELKELIEKEPD